MRDFAGRLRGGRPPFQIAHGPVHDNARMGMVPCDAMLRRPAALLMFQAKKQFRLGPLWSWKDSLYE
ncbi:hypothetical protein WN72_21365 [Bradyrhizobium arachidis]|uniref:Uncharacterized protein n=1 Tax=Bradyrhizobium arachidis TaxID=858423 RepID=A0AAE7NQQ0_9BRAD|nr:hypothetical protein WN72_21365 [Bradyrhizobium arachidis]